MRWTNETTKTISENLYIYTLFLMLMIALLASGMFYLLAPIMTGEDAIIVEDVPGMASAAIPRNNEITQAILGSLPYTMAICIVISLISAFLFSRAITKPIKHIVEAQSPVFPRLKRSRCRSSQEVNDSPTPFSALNYC